MRQAVSWLRRAVEKASLEAEKGALYSNFGFDDDTPQEVESAIMSHPRLRRVYEYAESYFLARAHGDPDHSGTPWGEASRFLHAQMEELPEES